MKLFVARPKSCPVTCGWWWGYQKTLSLRVSSHSVTWECWLLMVAMTQRLKPAHSIDPNARLKPCSATVAQSEKNGFGMTEVMLYSRRRFMQFVSPGRSRNTVDWPDPA